MDSLDAHFQLKKNTTMARQTYLAAEPNAGETVNNLVTRLLRLVDDCDYGEEKGNQVCDKVLRFITDKSLRSKIYRKDGTLTELLEIVNEYHDQDALVLMPVVPSVLEPDVAP